MGTADAPTADPLLAATEEDRFDDNEMGLLASQGPYDNADDEEADKIYAAIDEAMAEAGKIKREFMKL